MTTSALGHAQQEPRRTGVGRIVALHRSRQESAVAPDLVEGRARRRLARDPERLAARVALEQLQVVEAGVRGVQEAEAVLARLDRQARPHLAVDERDVPEELGHPRLEIEELAVAGERAVLDHERDLVAAARQVELCFARIAQETKIPPDRRRCSGDPPPWRDRGTRASWPAASWDTGGLAPARVNQSIGSPSLAEGLWLPCR